MEKRKVEFKSKMPLTDAKISKGTFLGWGLDIEYDSENRSSSFTVGIIEDEERQVLLVYAPLIKFID